MDAVIHNASPLSPENPDDRDSFVKPALGGVEGVFNAILKNTSSIRNVV